MATMKDIAKLAKVSTSTVSHVINGTRFVSDEIKEKVLSVVEQLNYTPSSVARSLKMKETSTLGMVVTASNNPFFSEMIRCVERYCQRNSYNLVLSYTDGDEERLNKNVDTLLRKQVDGLLLMCSENEWQLSQHLSSRLTLPIVILDWWPSPLVNASKVHEDSVLGGYLATKTLIEHGHRAIAIITGKLNNTQAYNRLQGYKQVLSEFNIPFNQQWVIEAGFDVESGVYGMNKLLELSTRPSAVFACSDTIAIGIYHAIWKAGLTVGEDISVIGYDDINITQYLSPPLTTIHQPKHTIAKHAVESLVEQIKNNTQWEQKTLVFPPSVVLRESIKYISKENRHM